MRNSGNGAFVASHLTEADSLIRNLSVADLNNDAIVDIAAVDELNSDIIIFHGTAEGHFERAGNMFAATGPFGVVAADLNQDGDTDLAVSARGSRDCGAFEDGRLVVLWNEEDGHFALGEALDLGGSPVEIESEDLNADGRPDLVCSNRGEWNGNDYLDATLNVLYNLGERRFRHVRVPTAGSNPHDLHISDVNTDGRPDLMVGRLRQRDINGHS